MRVILYIVVVSKTFIGVTAGLFVAGVYLAFVTCTGHPALEKTECADDFVLLRLHFGWNVVFIQLLLFNSVDRLM